MTAPQDPFRSPEPGQPPHGDDSPRPAPDQYGSGQYGSGQPGSSQHGSGQHGSGQHGDDPYRSEPADADQYRSQQYGSQQYGSPGYGAAPYGSAPRQDPRNGLGIAALVLGILALLTGLFVVGAAFGVAAIVLGFLGRARVKRGEATNGGMALAGIILGVLGLLLSILVIIGVTSLFQSEQVGNLAECLENAGGDRAAQQQCEADFQEELTGG